MTIWRKYRCIKSMCTRKPGKYEKKKTVLASLNNKNNVGIAVKDTFFSEIRCLVFFFIYSSSQYCIVVNKP